MMEEQIPAIIPIIRVKSTLKVNTPSIHDLLQQLKAFIINFLQHSQIQNIQKQEQLVRYLSLNGNNSFLIQQITNTLINHMKTYLKSSFEGQPLSICKSILSIHNDLLKKVQLLAELFQQIEGRVKNYSIIAKYLQSQQQVICSEPNILDILIEAFFKIVKQYREQKCELINQNLAFLQMIQKIGIYNKIAESHQLISNTYYEQRRFKLLREDKWIMLVERQLEKQAALCQVIENSHNNLRTANKELIKETLPQLLGLVLKLLQFQDLDQLKIVWKYVKMAGQKASLQRILEQRIQKQQNSLVKLGIEKIILDKLKIMQICLKCFDNDRELLSRIELSFENILSRQSTLANEMMAEYLVAKLNLVQISPQQQIVLFQMFKTNPSKDFLIEQYKHLLSKYILVDNIDLTAHSNFVHNLSNFFGNTFTKSLQTILSDVWQNNKPLTFQYGKLSCRILNKHEWPKIDAPQLVLPDQLLTLKQQFLDEYLRIKPNHELKWIHWLSDVTLSIDGVDIVVSEIQAAIIYFIARAIRPMKRRELATAIQVDINLINPQLQALKNINLVVQDRNQGLEISYDNIAPYHYSKTYQPPIKTKNHIITDRALTIEANIVRIMKKKKTLQISNVIKKVIEDVKRFRPTIEQINICLKNLHVRQFVEIQEGGIVKYKM